MVTKHDRAGVAPILPTGIYVGAGPDRVVEIGDLLAPFPKLLRLVQNTSFLEKDLATYPLTGVLLSLRHAVPSKTIIDILGAGRAQEEKEQELGHDFLWSYLLLIRRTVKSSPRTVAGCRRNLHAQSFSPAFLRYSNAAIRDPSSSAVPASRLP